jgi:hypothetical protein
VRFLDAVKLAVEDNKEIKRCFDSDKEWVHWDGERLVDRQGNHSFENWEWNVWCDDWEILCWDSKKGEMITNGLWEVNQIVPSLTVKGVA